MKIIVFFKDNKPLSIIATLLVMTGAIALTMIFEFSSIYLISGKL